MTTENFLAELQRLRVHISLDGERLRVTAPAGSLPLETQKEIAARKREIVQFLRTAAAASTSENDAAAVRRSLVAFRERGSKPPVFITPNIEGKAGALWASLAQELGADQPVYGLQSVDSDGRWIQLESVEAAAAQFVRDIQAICPRGPYNVLACCAGGPIGYEIAQILRSTGEHTRLAMLDTWPPRVMEALQGSPQTMANGRVLARYAPNRYEGSILLLLTSGQVFPGQDPRLYWASLAAYCTVVRLPGNDVDDLFRTVSALAEPLRPYFAEDTAAAQRAALEEC